MTDTTVATEERVTIEIEGGVADVRLARAEKHNGLDAAMFDRLVEAATGLRDEPSLRAVVLSGEGPSFCAGLDFKAVMAGTGLTADLAFAREDGDVANHAQRAAYDWSRIPVPVIGALHGACIGGGFQIAIATDIRIAAPGTRFSVKEIDYGLIPDMSITTSLPDLVGIDVAKELTFTGRMFEADEALELGIVTRIADDPRAEALTLAAEIAAKSPDAIRRAKRLLDETWRTPRADGLALEAELQGELMGSPNQLEAVKATLTGEAPDFADPS